MSLTTRARVICSSTCNIAICLPTIVTASRGPLATRLMSFPVTGSTSRHVAYSIGNDTSTVWLDWNCGRRTQEFLHAPDPGQLICKQLHLQCRLRFVQLFATVDKSDVCCHPSVEVTTYQSKDFITSAFMTTPKNHRLRLAINPSSDTVYVFFVVSLVMLIQQEPVEADQIRLRWLTVSILQYFQPPSSNQVSNFSSAFRFPERGRLFACCEYLKKYRFVQ